MVPVVILWWYLQSNHRIVLGPLLFILYTIPLSTFVLSFSVNHHLYTDDTQLFLSFHPSTFHSSIAHLQVVLNHISSWMSANLLTLNSSKTEFLLIGLKQKLATIDSSFLDTTHSAHNLALYLMSIVPSLIKSLHCLSVAILTSSLFAASVLT